MNIIEFINETKLMNSVLLTFTTQIRTQLLSQPGQQWALYPTINRPQQDQVRPKQEDRQLYQQYAPKVDVEDRR